MTRPFVPHIVQQGDHVERLAFLAGADPEEVWNDPSNAAIKAKRTSMHVLSPGDVIYLPDGPREGVTLKKGTTNKYHAEIRKIDVRVVLQSRSGPIANEPYEVRGLPLREGATPPSGTTDDKGTVALRLPITVSEVSIFLRKKNVVYAVRVGDMDPIEEASGVRKRLENLGYLRAGLGADDLGLETAVRAFQARSGLPVTGQVDDATKAKLTEVAGQ